MNRLRKNLILAGGIVMVALGLFHATFWLNPMWSSELAKLHPKMSALVQLFNICNVTLLTALGVALLVCRSKTEKEYRF
jgi:sulfite exporter TauE/SafE